MKRTFEKAQSDGNPPKKQRVTPRPPERFRGTGSQAKAFDYADTRDGVVISRDDGPDWKQYYVCENWGHAYDFVFSQPKKQRNFYELIREHAPAKLVIDLDLKPDELEPGESLLETMDAIQAQVIRVTLEKLAEVGVPLSEDDVQIYHSDGPEKGSRHLLFPAWFTNLKPSVKAFALQHLLPFLAKRGFDDSIYSKNRNMRFFGNTKTGSNRCLHIKGRPLEPGTDEHRAAFMKSRVAEPPPDDFQLLDFAPANLPSKSSKSEQALISDFILDHVAEERAASSGSYTDQLKAYVLESMTDCSTTASIRETEVLNNGCVKLHTNSRFCWNKNACHKSNHVNYIAGRRGIQQACYDEDCSKTAWEPWPSPRRDFVNHLFFGRPPQTQTKGKHVPPSRSAEFLDWTMKSQPMDPSNILSGDAVPDFFDKAPFKLYEKDIYGFLKLKNMFLCGSDNKHLPTIPREFLQLDKKHKDWLIMLKRALTSRGQKYLFVARYLQEEEEERFRNEDTRPDRAKIDFVAEFRADPKSKILLDRVEKWCKDQKNIPKLQVFEMFQSAPLNAMRDYYTEIKTRIDQQVVPFQSPTGCDKRLLYDVLLSAGVDVQLGTVLEDDMLLKLMLHIVDTKRWARQAVSNIDKQSGRVFCPVLKYNPNTRVYDKCFDCLNDFCIHVLRNLRVDYNNCAGKYLASNPRVMTVLLRSLDQHWQPLQPDRRYVAFQNGIYDRFCEQDGVLGGKFYPDGTPEFRAVSSDATQDIYRFFDVPFQAKPTDKWEFNKLDGKTVAAMKPSYTGELHTVIDKILQYQGLSEEDRFVIWAAIGRSMVGIKHAKIRFDGLKMTFYLDGESDTGKTIILEIVTHAHPEEQVGAFSDEKSFPLSTAVHTSIIVNHESNRMVVPFTTWRNVAEGVDVAAAIKYSAAFYGCIDAMIVGAGNGVCTNYPDTGGAKSARLCRVPMSRIVETKDSTLLDQAKSSYGVIMHKAISAYWTWLQCCVKKGTWYASLSKESVLYGREAKSRHHLLERFIAERMHVVGFKHRVDETFKFTRGVPSIKLEHPLTSPESAPDSEPRVTLRDFAKLYYQWIVTSSEADDFDNPYVTEDDCIEKCFNPGDKKLNTNLGQNFFWNKYHCVMKKAKLGSETKSKHVVYGMREIEPVLYTMSGENK